MTSPGESIRAKGFVPPERDAFWISPDWLDQREDAAEATTLRDTADVAIRLASLLHLEGSAETAKALWVLAKPESKVSTVASTLLASAHLGLSRASLAAGRPERAEAHLDRFLAGGGPTAVSPLVRKRWNDHAKLRLDQHRVAARRIGAVPPAVAKQLASDWLRAYLAECLASDDPLLAIETGVASDLERDQDRRDLLRAAAEYFLARGDRIRCIHYLARAAKVGEPCEAEREDIAKGLLRAGDTGRALLLVWADALLLRFPSESDADIRMGLNQAFQEVVSRANASSEHGHTLLIEFLELHADQIRNGARGRRPFVVEIGTTREDLSSQGSTLKIARKCAALGFLFATVDMDPANSLGVRYDLSRLCEKFVAATAPGERYLAMSDEPLDAVFLDAYDFDHGKHSALRQARYRKYLGAAIDERQCHQMHLECAVHVARRLAPHGVVCIDDTWLDNGAWTAKGTLAVPYLLDQGFHILEARNRAVLMARRP